MLLGTPESSPKHGCGTVHCAPPREDVDLLLEASELGRCGGVGSVISSGDFQTRNRSE